MEPLPGIYAAMLVRIPPVPSRLMRRGGESMREWHTSTAPFSFIPGHRRTRSVEPSCTKHGVSESSRVESSEVTSPSSSLRSLAIKLLSSTAQLSNHSSSAIIRHLSTWIVIRPPYWYRQLHQRELEFKRVYVMYREPDGPSEVRRRLMVDSAAYVTQF